MYKLLATSRYIKEIKEISKKCKIDKSIYFIVVLIEVEKFIRANVFLKELNIKLPNPDYLIEGYKCYKLRIKDLCGSKGKRGGYRFILGINTDKKKIVFLTIYSKSQKENILDKEIEEILKSEMEEHNPCMEPISNILERFEN